MKAEADNLLEAPEYTPYQGRGEYTKSVPDPYFGRVNQLSFHAHASAHDRPGFFFHRDTKYLHPEEVRAERERLSAKLDKEIARQQQTRPLGRTQTLVAPSALDRHVRKVLTGRNYVRTQSPGSHERSRNTELIRSLVHKQQPGERLYRIVTHGVKEDFPYDVAALYFNATPEDFETIRLELEQLQRRKAAAKLTGHKLPDTGVYDPESVMWSSGEASQITLVSPVNLERARAAVEPQEYVVTTARERNSEAVAGLAGLLQPGQKMYRIISRSNKFPFRDASSIYFTATQDEAEAVKQRLQALTKRRRDEAVTEATKLLEAPPELAFHVAEEPEGGPPPLSYSPASVSFNVYDGLKDVIVYRRPEYPVSTWYTGGTVRRTRVVQANASEDEIKKVVDELKAKVDAAVEKELKKAKRLAHLDKPETLVAPTNLTVAVRNIVEPYDYIYSPSGSYSDGADRVAALSRRVKPGESIYRIIGSGQSPGTVGTSSIYFIATPEEAKTVDLALQRLARTKAAEKMQESA